MKSDFLVDCLIPSNNINITTLETLKSLQNYDFLRIILVCDMDAAVNRDAIQQIRYQIKNIIIVENTIQKGLPGTLNSGLAHCSAPFVMRLDDGDINIRADLYKDLCNWPEDLDMKCFNIQLFTQEKKLTVVKCKVTKSLGALSLYARVPHPTWIFKRERVKIFYGLDDVRCEDYGLIVRNDLNIQCSNSVSTLYDVGNTLGFLTEIHSTISKAQIFMRHCDNQFFGKIYASLFIISRITRLTLSRRKFFMIQNIS